MPRFALSLWCRPHTNIAVRHGHPAGRSLSPKLWAKERTSVAALLDANPDHPGQLQVLRWLKDWMQECSRMAELRPPAGRANQGTHAGAEEVVRLIRHGVTARDILVELCAFQAWEAANPAALPSDLARDFALSRALMALAPRPRRKTRAPSGLWPVDQKLQKKAGCESYSIPPAKSALRRLGPHLRKALAPFIVNVLGSLKTPEELEEARKAAMRLPLAPAA